jgi:hypothetical protein
MDSGSSFNSNFQLTYGVNEIGGGALGSVNGSYVNVNVAPSGNQIWGGTAGPYNTAQPTAVLDPGYLMGECRIIGSAFEVVNTTSALNRQGLVTCYRMPAPVPSQTATELYTNSSGNLFGTMETWRCRMPPKTLAEAMLLEGSQTWEAEKGCYVVSTMNQLENPSVQPRPVVPCWDLDDQVVRNEAFPDPFLAQTGATFSAPSSGDEFYIPSGNSMIIPYNVGGAYFTGLSQQSTLQLTVKYYIERFPDPFNTDLVVLAQPSAGFDPCALELYAHTISKMPVGVPQGMNSLGDWFKGVVNKVSSFATPILKTLAPFHPGFGLAAGLSGAAKALTSGKQQKGIRRITETITEDGAGIRRRAGRRAKIRRRGARIGPRGAEYNANGQGYLTTDRRAQF